MSDRRLYSPKLAAQIRQAMNTLAYRRAEAGLVKDKKIIAVCLVGYKTRVPRYFGDNMGVQPVHIVVSGDPRNAHKREDLAQPLHELVTLRYVYTTSEAHAARLKVEIDRLLLGDDSARLRKSWRHFDVEFGPNADNTAWEIILDCACRKIQSRGEAVETFDEDGKIWRVLKRMRQKVR